MIFFYEELLPLMDEGVFLPFRDRKFGAGVYSEARFLETRGKPIYEIDYEGNISPLSLRYDKFIPYKFSRRLSIEETKDRLGSEYNER